MIYLIGLVVVCWILIRVVGLVGAAIADSISPTLGWLVIVLGMVAVVMWGCA